MTSHQFSDPEIEFKSIYRTIKFVHQVCQNCKAIRYLMHRDGQWHVEPVDFYQTPDSCEDEYILEVMLS